MLILPGFVLATNLVQWNAPLVVWYVLVACGCNHNIRVVYQISIWGSQNRYQIDVCLHYLDYTQIGLHAENLFTILGSTRNMVAWTHLIIFIVITNKIFIRAQNIMRKIATCPIWICQSSCTIACFIAYEKRAQSEKFPFKAHLPCTITKQGLQLQVHCRLLMLTLKGHGFSTNCHIHNLYRLHQIQKSCLYIYVFETLLYMLSCVKEKIKTYSFCTLIIECTCIYIKKHPNYIFELESSPTSKYLAYSNNALKE